MWNKDTYEGFVPHKEWCKPEWISYLYTIYEGGEDTLVNVWCDECQESSIRSESELWKVWEG